MSKTTPTMLDAIKARVSQLNDVKAHLVSLLVEDYTSYETLHPSDYVANGLKGARNVGMAYAAYYIVKSGIDADLVTNYDFIGDAFGTIVVHTDKVMMKAEYDTKLAAWLKANDAQDKVNDENGVALTESLKDLLPKIKSAAKAKSVPSHKSDKLLAEINDLVAVINSDYRAAIALQQYESTLVSK